MVIGEDAETFAKIVADVSRVVKECEIAVDVSRVRQGTWNDLKSPQEHFEGDWIARFDQD